MSECECTLDNECILHRAISRLESERDRLKAELEEARKIEVKNFNQFKEDRDLWKEKAEALELEKKTSAHITLRLMTAKAERAERQVVKLAEALRKIASYYPVDEIRDMSKDEMKRLKEIQNDVMRCDKETFYLIKALLVRLEAAENNMNSHSVTCFDKNICKCGKKEKEEAWRKSKGE